MIKCDTVILDSSIWRGLACRAINSIYIWKLELSISNQRVLYGKSIQEFGFRVGTESSGDLPWLTYIHNWGLKLLSFPEGLDLKTVCSRGDYSIDILQLYHCNVLFTGYS